jgi:2-polyprenyl-3-methyl-5-hydroxy-6-metoxy-1,4-benzoquinol methylase
MQDNQPTGDTQYHSHARPEMLAYIPPRSQMVLDIGCASGAFGHSIKSELGAVVWGVEANPVVAREAAKKLDRVFVGDIDIVVREIEDNMFDAIVCNDVLEHCAEPDQVLRKLRPKLKKTGVVISSIPNIRYFRALQTIVLRKEFPRDDEGIFDRTHLRFFTYKSIEKLFADSGYKIVKMEGINGSRSRKLYLLNLVTFGSFLDAKWLQFATVAAPYDPDF